MMTYTQVIKKRLSISSKIDKLNQELTDLQESCPHINLRYRYNGYSSGWDYDASYWTEWYCPDCEKRWIGDQKFPYVEEQKRLYPNAKEIGRYDLPIKYKHFYDEHYFQKD